MEEIKSHEHTQEPLHELAERIKENQENLPGLIVAIRNAILEHARSLSEQYEPKNIIESRFTSTEQAFEKGMLSCGAMANMSTEMLRHLGFKVKLVHGESEDSVDHAWITVFDPSIDTWKDFDPTQADGSIPPTHIKKGEIDSWEEIRDQIEQDHKTLRERQKEKGL